MGCCIARPKVSLPHQVRVPETIVPVFTMQEDSSQELSILIGEDYNTSLPLSSLEDLDDDEVWSRVKFAETVEADQEGWKDRSRDNGIAIRTKLFSFNNITNEVLMGDLNFQCKVSEHMLIDLLNSKEKRMEWDKTITLMEIQESNDPSDAVVFTRMEMMLIVKRYYVERRLIRRYKNSVVIVNYSIHLPHDLVPKSIQEGATFVNLVAGLYFIREKEEGTVMRMILMIEPLKNTTYSSITINGVKSWMNTLRKKVLNEVNLSSQKN
jgi:hypothetical protein